MKQFKKIIILGSGGLSIGQAGEFDYSGSQAIKALREENIEVIVINPNIATVQTNPDPGVRVYLYPVEKEWVEKIISEEKPDGIIAGFGGQTALNCILKLDEAGTLKKHKVQNLGTQIDSLRTTEDRKLFAEKMKSIGMPVLTSETASTLEEAHRVALEIGFPVIVRAAYALGGLGSGFAYNPNELETLVRNALNHSPQVLIEKSLKGWKEVEYEVMRDSADHAITICNMENIDPLGIHTGDSIVIAPSQTLSDLEYQTLRNASLRIVRSLQIVGECNVQFALDPKSLDFFVIEVNARLSRSSALASKASGYPIAFIAAKVVLGFSLLELKNPVTGMTSAFYEPAMDYITIKIPRWDMEKFQGTSRLLGSSMKSVGEIMAIGRNFHEALQKAVRMVTEQAEGLLLPFDKSKAELIDFLKNPTDQRLFVIFSALRNGITTDEINQLTEINPWFLDQMNEIVKTEREITKFKLNLKAVPKTQWTQWKKMGFGDEQIALLLYPTTPNDTKKQSLEIRKTRLALGVQPYAKKIDTTAAEYPSPSNYLYMSYSASAHDTLPPLSQNKKNQPTAIILGGGAYRVGSSVEFDWCAVSSSQHLQELGWSSVIINCNPETVSTDYNSSNRLYFEELSLERILDIVDFEKAQGVVVSVGGQLPNRLSKSLSEAGIKLLGHKQDTIDCAEDRHRFSSLLDRIHVQQPKWISAQSKDEILKFTQKEQFPFIIRPSYVLSGAAMNVAWNPESLEKHLKQAEHVSKEHPVVVSKFIEGAKEVEVDGISYQGQIKVAAMSEHVENAGVHSGDATLVFPTQSLNPQIIDEIKKISSMISEKLELNGPFNIQYMVHHEKVLVIECNARSSRSFPFISKVSGIHLSKLAAEVMVDQIQSPLIQDPPTTPPPTKTPWISHTPQNQIGVKAAMFSFNRLSGIDPILGVEMLSTGEVGCIAQSFDESLLLALKSTGTQTPTRGVLISAGPKSEKAKILPALAYFQKSKIKIYTTSGTATFLESHGFSTEALAWPNEGKSDVLQAIRERWVDLVINIPKSLDEDELQHSVLIRKTAIQHGLSLITDLEKAVAYLNALQKFPEIVKSHIPKRLL